MKKLILLSITSLIGLSAIIYQFPLIGYLLLCFLILISLIISICTLIVFKVSKLRIKCLHYLLKNREVAEKTKYEIVKKIYAFLAQSLGGKKPKLYELQDALPKLPIPSLEQTCRKFLASVKPILNEEEYEKTEKSVHDFFKGPGPILQHALKQYAKTQPINWLEEWWERFVYLKWRNPTVGYISWYGTDRIEPLLRTNQIDRAVNVLRAVLMFKQLMDTQELEPIRAFGIPFCMWQYSRLFAINREPGLEEDKLRVYTNENPTWIVAIANNQMYRIDLYPDNRPLNRAELRTQFEFILNSSSSSSTNSTSTSTSTSSTSTSKDQHQYQQAIGSLTALERPTWAQLRQHLIELGNQHALDIVEKSLFVICLEDFCHEQSIENSSLQLFAGNIGNRWFDKSFNLVIFSNGRFGCNVEHTWADAPVMVHLFDYVFKIESSAEWPDDSSPIRTLPLPKQLIWKTDQKINDAVTNALTIHQKQLTQSIELKIINFNSFGKGFIKQCKMSPDGFVQMAIQLAYYNKHKKTVLTYESSHTRYFLHGRTETVRSASVQSRDWVLAMQDRMRPNKEKISLLKAAIQAHNNYMRESMSGNGIDRHLLGLKIIALASGQQMPDIFQDKAYNLEFTLSTSQTPAYRTNGGGFAPVAAGGYGVSYVVSEDYLIFHITSWRQHPETNAAEFAEILTEALLQMQSMCVASTAIRRTLSKGELTTE
eukprot:TRINITY_DN38_c4_g2_i1.p1 TRINITY_DN38_c4_g2~~TRINITY_DN38_c4_g2_i1.p1  ORF type:complete len:729 (+),score=362.80 TRINITY_DN38_c4_g2_i1:56-2188(+)